MNTVFLHIGSNLGNKGKNLAIARLFIKERIGPIQKQSHVYKTEAWGNEKQPEFYNQALKILTPATADKVLAEAKGIEKLLGRLNLERWGQRIIDIDILFFNDAVIQSEKLQIPHKLLHKRNFVLIPLCEIAPEFTHPALSRTIEDLLKLSHDVKEVSILDAQ